jgi:hypothetical protein
MWLFDLCHRVAHHNDLRAAIALVFLIGAVLLVVGLYLYTRKKYPTPPKSAGQ